MITVDLEGRLVTVDRDGSPETFPLDSPEAFAAITRAWLRSGWELKYTYGFTWLGRPVIQTPEDLIRMQEVIWAMRPDVIIETGVAHGGSLVFHASVCRLLGHGRVIGVDVHIRPHNRAAIESHPLADLITLVEGSSTDPAVVAEVRGSVQPEERTFVVLDSDHSRSHVLAELLAYAGLVKPGDYLVVADTLMKDLAGAPRARPDWGWNNPDGAIDEFLAGHPHFERRDPPRLFEETLGASKSASYWPGGWLRRIP